MPPQSVMDQGEQVLRQLGEVTGVRGYTCPWQAMRDPFVAAVVSLHADLKRGLSLDPKQLPRALLDGLRVYDATLNRVQTHDWERERQEREAEAEAKRGATDFRRGPPRGGRRR